MKVGGHQASSASMASIMTALWFAHLNSQDRVSVKPHASPVLHAIEYLLGQLDEKYLTTLRAFGGLQSYPSRLKDPVPADFSTGSVGIGATATVWSAIAHRYVAGHFDVPGGGRHVALVGDAELDEGAIWETVMDPVASRLGEVLWIVDLNRQSLDRIVPDIAAGRLTGMFESAGWHTITVKYGRWLRELFERDGDPHCVGASTRCLTRSTSGCCVPAPRSCASGCPAAVAPGARSRGRSAELARATSSFARFVTSAGMTSLIS